MFIEIHLTLVTPFPAVMEAVFGIAAQTHPHNTPTVEQNIVKACHMATAPRTRIVVIK
jgi:hypothetical protein